MFTVNRIYAQKSKYILYGIYTFCVRKEQSNMSIKYTIDILKELKNKGFTTYRIRKEKLLSEGTIQKFRNNDTNVTLNNIETVCTLLNCQPADIIEYISDKND